MGEWREAEAAVAALVDASGCEGLAHALELIALLVSAADVLRSLLGSTAAASIRSGLDRLRARGQTATRAAQAEQASRLAAAAERAAHGKKGPRDGGDDEAKPATGGEAPSGHKAAAAGAAGAAGASAGERPRPDGEEKESELLQRAAMGLKELSQRLTAPGKGD